MKARILVADDHPLLREGLVQLLNCQDDLTVCGEAESIPSTRAEVSRELPDLLLLDLRLGAGDTIELIKAMRIEYPQMPVLVLSALEETQFAERALRAGANGYVTKYETTQEVLSAIRTVLSGEMYLSRKMAVRVLQQTLGVAPLQTPKRTDVSIERLSDREFHVFQMLGSGLTGRQIAEALKLSIKTIEAHRENIKNKLSFHTGAELVEAATAWIRKNVLPGSKDNLSVVRKKSERLG